MPYAPREAASPLPSLAVLPFHNLSGDAAQDYFADGIVDDLITALSRFKTFAVISRNSSFVYKGRAVDIREIGRELGVRYVLEGSIRRSGNRLRVTAQLVDAATAAHLWAQNYDGALEDVFDMQDRITESVVSIVEPMVKRAEIERTRLKPPTSLDAYDLYLEAMALVLTTEPGATRDAIELIERSLVLDPSFPPAIAIATIRPHVALRSANAGRDRGNAAQGSRVCPRCAGRRRQRCKCPGNRRNIGHHARRRV